jgi:Nif-specific regulatory protein
MEQRSRPWTSVRDLLPGALVSETQAAAKRPLQKASAATREREVLGPADSGRSDRDRSDNDRSNIDRRDIDRRDIDRRDIDRRDIDRRDIDRRDIDRRDIDRRDLGEPQVAAPSTVRAWYRRGLAMQAADRQESSLEDVERLRQERDLYRTLLDLGAHDSIERLTETALGLVTSMCGARKGYLEIFDDRGAKPDPLRYRVSLGCSDAEVEQIRDVVSHGIIAEAVASGEPVVTASALLDQRFRDRRSVQQNHIEAVLCVPIGADSATGVLYLQDRTSRGPFTDAELRLSQTFATYLAVFAERLLVKRRLEDQTDPTVPYRNALRLTNFIGRSPAIADTLAHVSLVAPLDVAVLLTGPSGTGKTQLARILHDNSARAGQPFVELNCAAIPEALLESELFGAMPGAHSTATKRVEGKLDAAEHGTLFLDEVGELSAATQAKLLQFLQSRQYYPLGSNKLLTADVRVFAATNADLRALVQERRFREDLLYRLEVLPLRVPSLSERSEDVPELMEFFAARACQAHRFGRLRFSPAAMQAGISAVWPGNVRQLEHAVEAAVIRASGTGSLAIERGHLFPNQPKTASERRETPTFQQATRQFQEQLLRETLRDTGWNVAQTAEKLDVARSHIYTLIRSFGLQKS